MSGTNPEAALKSLRQIAAVLVPFAIGVGVGLLSYSALESPFPLFAQRWFLLALTAATVAAFYFSSRFYEASRSQFNGWLVVVVVFICVLGLARGCEYLGDGTADAARPWMMFRKINWGDFFVQVTATLIGAFAGASFAYLNERRKAEAEELKARAAAVNLAIHSLGDMYAVYQTYKQQVIDPHRSDPNNWYTMRPTDLMWSEVPTFAYPDLQFLFRSSNPNVLSKLAMVTRNFKATRNIAERRAQMHLTELQPAIEKTGRADSHTPEFVAAAVGPRIMYTMKEYTQGLITNVAHDIPLIEELQKEMIAAAKPMIGPHKVIRFMPNLIGLAEKEALEKLTGL